MFTSWANSLPHAIRIGEVLDFDLDFDFNPPGGVLLDSSSYKSLLVCGLHSYALFVFPILSNKVIV